MDDWKTQIQAELERASSARQQGKEGQARVCARRAAGIAIREYYARRGQALRSPSAFDLLKLFLDDDQGTPELRRSAAYLTMRVNEEFNLPDNVDLLVEARQFCTTLLEGRQSRTD